MRSSELDAKALAVEAHLADTCITVDSHMWIKTVRRKHMSAPQQSGTELIRPISSNLHSSLLKQTKSDSAEERAPSISTCLKSVTKITTQEKIERRDNDSDDKIIYFNPIIYYS